MIDINLLPPHLSNAGRKSFARAFLFRFVIVLLLALGVAAANYAFRVIPSLVARRDRLLAAGETAVEDAFRAAAAGGLYSRRIVWSHTLADIQEAANAVNGEDAESVLRLTLVEADMGALMLEGFALAPDREKGEKLAAALPAALAATATVRDAKLTKMRWATVPGTDSGTSREACWFSLEAVAE